MCSSWTCEEFGRTDQFHCTHADGPLFIGAGLDQRVIIMPNFIKYRTILGLRELFAAMSYRNRCMTAVPLCAEFCSSYHSYEG